MGRVSCNVAEASILPSATSRSIQLNSTDNDLHHNPAVAEPLRADAYGSERQYRGRSQATVQVQVISTNHVDGVDEVNATNLDDV